MADDPFEMAVDAAQAAVIAYQKDAREALWHSPARGQVAATIRAQYDRAEAAEARLAAQSEYETYRRALWVLVRQLGNHVFIAASQMEDVPLLASLGVGKEPGGIRVVAEEEP